MSLRDRLESASRDVPGRRSTAVVGGGKFILIIVRQTPTVLREDRKGRRTVQTRSTSAEGL